MSGDHDKYHGTCEVPKREWVGLTDGDIDDIKQTAPVYVSAKAVNAIVPMVEAKLLEKNVPIPKSVEEYGWK